MRGTILIVDGMATRRILIKAKLAPGFYNIVQTDDCATALGLAGDQIPDVIIAADTLPDADAVTFCERIKAHPALGRVPVLIVAAQDNPEARRRILAAGAQDVMSQPVDDLILLARVRSLIRAHSSAEELRLRDGTSRALGFAEPVAGFAPRAGVALVTHDALTGARWQARLRSLLNHELRHMTLDDALCAVASGPVPDVFVIDLPAHPAMKGLSLLAELRARPDLRHARVIAVLSSPDQSLAANALDLGASDVMLQGFEPGELALRLATQVVQKRTQDRLRDTVRDGLQAAVIDPLTGLFNRRYAMPHLGRIAAHAAETGRSFAVMLADLDHFKSINDRFGHAAGDAVLREAARRLSGNLRAVDMVARVGGEEFLIVMPDTDRAAARAAGERLRGQIDQMPFALPGHRDPLHVTVSIGITVSPGRDAPATMHRLNRVDGTDWLIDMADAELYRAKGAGRNTVSLTKPAA